MYSSQGKRWKFCIVCYGALGFSRKNVSISLESPRPGLSHKGCKNSYLNSWSRRNDCTIGRPQAKCKRSMLAGCNFSFLVKRLPRTIWNFMKF
jgi:hypothetical protein